MSLISGSYSRACGGGGAPDCRGDIVENCLKEGVRCEAAKVALQLRARGARRARAGSRRFLEAVRTPRLIADMIVNWMKRGEFQLQRRVQASPKENLRLATLLFCLVWFGFYSWTFRAQEYGGAAHLGNYRVNLVTCPHFPTRAGGSNFVPSRRTSQRQTTLCGLSIRRKGETYLLRSICLSHEKRASGLI